MTNVRSTPTSPDHSSERAAAVALGSGRLREICLTLGSMTDISTLHTPTLHDNIVTVRQPWRALFAPIALH
jgi:hypothetical protein